MSPGAWVILLGLALVVAIVAMDRDDRWRH